MKYYFLDLKKITGEVGRYVAIVSRPHADRIKDDDFWIVHKCSKNELGWVTSSIFYKFKDKYYVTNKFKFLGNFNNLDECAKKYPEYFI